MDNIKIGLLKETKTPPDKRAALTPTTAYELKERFPNVDIKIQSSEIRAFKDYEYLDAGFEVVEDISDCDLLIGVKEVNIPAFIPNKHYMFFSHIAKKQEYNKPLLKAILKNKLTLTDYEYLTNDNGMRLVAFGKWAGVVGAYNALRTWGLKTKNFDLKPAHDYHDKNEMYSHLENFNLNPIKIAITGGGRVAHGAMETIRACGVKEVSPEDFLTNNYNEAVFSKIEPWDYVQHKEGKDFDLVHFFNNPSEYESTFKPYTKVADVYIACHFWDPNSPIFISKQDMKESDFNIKVIADVSCDIAGPIASTLRASTIAEPFYDYNPETEKEELAFSNEKNISVMAIDNLPGELARDSSEDFSMTLLDNIFPYLLGNDSHEIIKRGTIVEKGKLTENFNYLNDWLKN